MLYSTGKYFVHKCPPPSLVYSVKCCVQRPVIPTKLMLRKLLGVCFMAQDFRERKRSWNKTSYDKTIVVQPFVAKKTFDAKVFFCQLLYV